jgi:4-amino-4-deoxy-L-arabinose transferase-like glycosyltransferase
MAEINIRKKSKSPVWPWILGILAIVAIVVWLIARNNNNTDTQPTQSGSILKLQTESPVALKVKSMTQIPGIVYLKLETYVA